MNKNSILLNQLLGAKSDPDQAWYMLLKNKMKSSDGVNFSVKVGNLKLSSNKMNFKSSISEMVSYFKPVNTTSSSFINKSYKIEDSFREKLEKIPLCFDDEVLITIFAGNEKLLSKKQIVENFKDNFEVQISKVLIDSLLMSNYEVVVNIRLINSGTSRKILEKELLDSNVYFEKLMKESMGKILGMVDRKSSNKPSSKMSREMLKSRLELFGFKISLSNLDSFTKKFLEENLTIFDFDSFSGDFLSKAEIMKKFSKQISNESLLEESVETKKYREMLLGYIHQLENKNLVDFSHLNIDLSVGGI